MKERTQMLAINYANVFIAGMTLSAVLFGASRPVLGICLVAFQGVSVILLHRYCPQPA